jgi:outer membrane protein assembly factor BamB
VGGDLITDRNGDVYLWYETDSHVLKCDKRGKVLWNKRFSPPGQNSWGGILSNPKGDLYLTRRTGDMTVVSRLLPGGTLQNDIRFPNTGLYEIGANGGRMAIEFVPSVSDQFRGRQCLVRYSPNGTREWSVYLQDLAWTPDFTVPQAFSALKLGVDSQGNSYLLFGEVARGGVSNMMLKKYQSNGKPVWSRKLSLRSDADMAMRQDAAGNTYLVGQQDGWGYYIARFDSSGKQVWERRAIRKSGALENLEVAADRSGNTYIAGSAWGVGGHGKVAPFVAKHDESGRLLWRRELPKITMVTGLAADTKRVYVSGAVQGSGGPMHLISLGK